MTPNEIEKRIVRYGDLIPCKTAFIDAHTPGSDQKENTISYITIQTTGDTTDFGDLTVARADQAGASNGVRVGVFGGDGDQTTCDFVTIATTGNATDFGDTNIAGRNFRATAEFHGGINA